MEAHGAGPHGGAKEVLYRRFPGAGGPLLREDTRNLQGDLSLRTLEAEC